MDQNNDTVRLRCHHRTMGFRCSTFVLVLRGTDPRSVNCGGHKKAAKAVKVAQTKTTNMKEIHKDYLVK
jgi:hypothetical protein